MSVEEAGWLCVCWLHYGRAGGWATKQGLHKLECALWDVMMHKYQTTSSL